MRESGCNKRKARRQPAEGWKLKSGALLLACTMALTACGESKKELPQQAYSSEQVIQSMGNTKAPDYWPTQGWKTAKPEEHGVDSAALAAMVEEFKEHNLHSFVLIRDGYLLAEGYNQEMDADKRQPLFSVTKSVLSALTGMAIREGILTGVGHKLREFYPQVSADEQKGGITVENLLTMTSGLEWDNRGERSSVEMTDSPNWLQYVLNKPVTSKPGTVFTYSNGNAHLMSGVLQEAIGVPVSYYADATLLKPLGMTNAWWGLDPQGVSIGSWSLQLTTRDMAKFGLLYLQEGQWEGREVVPREWVRASIQKRVDQTIDGTRGGYGYFWWLKPISNASDESARHDVFYAAGSGGQRIFVVPDYNMILAVTANANSEKEIHMPEQLLAKTALAVKSDQPLQPSSEAEAKLAAALAGFKSVTDKPE